MIFMIKYNGTFVVGKSVCGDANWGGNQFAN
jgi:hypothetical protein